MNRLLAPLVLLAFALGLAGFGGCSSVAPAVSAIEARPAAAKLVVQYATLKLASTPARAAKVVEIATAVEAALAAPDAAVTVDNFSVLVFAAVPWDQIRDPADQLLVKNLIDLAAQELVARLGSTPPVNEAVPIGDLKAVVGWVIEAAKMAGAAR